MIVVGWSDMFMPEGLIFSSFAECSCVKDKIGPWDAPPRWVIIDIKLFAQGAKEREYSR